MFGIKGDAIMSKYDKLLLKMLNDETREIIIKTLKDFLAQLHTSQ